MVSSVSKYTPKDARLAKFRSAILLNIQKTASFNRKYPAVNVGDRVRIYTKKDKMDKERVGVWSKDSYEVERITESEGQNLFKTTHRERPYLRHELLLIK